MAHVNVLIRFLDIIACVARLCPARRASAILLERAKLMDDSSRLSLVSIACIDFHSLRGQATVFVVMMEPWSSGWPLSQVRIAVVGGI